MNTNPSQTSDEDIIAKYRKPIQESIESLGTEVMNYNFKPDNHFFDANSNKTVKSLDGFTILTVMHKFFCTDKSRNTYITNVIVDKSETLSFYKDKSKYKLFGKEEFSFDELEKKSFENVGVNRKIILVGIFEGKLTKIEASVISERNVLSYMKSNENTADICGVEKIYKDNATGNSNVTAVLSLTQSEKQITFDNKELIQHYKDLDTHITTLNKKLSLAGDAARKPKKDIVSEISKNASKEDLQNSLTSSDIQNDEVIEDKIEDSTETDETTGVAEISEIEDSTNDSIAEISSEKSEDIELENINDSSVTDSENSSEIIEPNFDFSTSSEG